MKWHHVKPPAMGSAGPAAPATDPYLRWAELTDWRGVRRLMGALGTGGEAIETVRVLVQARDDMPQADLAAALADPHWKVADVYKRPVPGTQQLARHFTAELWRTDLAWLKTNLWGMRWELALPFRDAETAARAVGIGSIGPTRAADSFRPPADKLFDIAPQAVQPGSVGDAIAVIDFGCPFLNRAFTGASEGRSRVVALWDQGSAVPTAMATPWADASPRMGYGRELCQATMNALLTEVRAGRPDAMDEGEAYRRIDYLIDYDDARRRIWGATHGSHVLDMAGGRVDPLTGQSGDAAGQADLVFVQLPSLTAADSAGGSLSAQVLDAVRYVLDTCRADARVVINLSYGSFAGPHDGSALIEQAMDELLQARAGQLAIVLGAGNARQADCHVRRSVGKNRSAVLRVGIPPGDFTDTFVEIWLDDRRHLGALRARVRTGDGDWCLPIAPGEQAELMDPNDARRVALLTMDSDVPNGHRPLLLLAIAPTARPADDDGPLAATGPWEVELFLDAGAQPAAAAADEAEIAFDAWVERDDPGGLGFGVQPRFIDTHFGDADETLSSLATGRCTIAVGGFRRSDGLAADYSSTGSRVGPAVVYAACEDDLDQPNVRGAAVRSDDSVRMNGTSVAAPAFARRLYNQLLSRTGPAITGDAWQTVIDEVVAAEALKQGLVKTAHPAELSHFKRAAAGA
jgi:hypothetical protein